MREKETGADTCRVYGTPKKYLRRASLTAPNGSFEPRLPEHVPRCDLSHVQTVRVLTCG
jgi:hypothetical protein